MMNSKPIAETTKIIPYWPYCETCKQPMEFEPEEPFAYCKCGTSEWGDPRPAEYVRNPRESDGTYAMRMTKLLKEQEDGGFCKAQS